MGRISIFDAYQGMMVVLSKSTGVIQLRTESDLFLRNTILTLKNNWEVNYGYSDFGRYFLENEWSDLVISGKSADRIYCRW